MKSIICPHCQKQIELSQALTTQIESDLLAEERKLHAQELVDAARQTGEKLATEMKMLKEDLAEKESKLRASQEAELQIRKERNALTEEKRTFELEKQRQLDAERGKIRQKAYEELMDQHRLKDKEKDQIIDQLKRSVDDMKRKAEQGSQQLQGETLELDLEALLRQAFPEDSIDPVGKGVLGADIRQTVRSKLGTDCGTILWESKRTKAWSDGWLAKLKNDMLKDKAHIPAIVSEVLPQHVVEGIGLMDGVYVVCPKLTIVLAGFLRDRLLAVAKQKKIAQNTQTKAESLYSYVTSHEFQHQVEAMIEIYFDMQTQISKERASYERNWKLREMQVTKLLSGVSGIYGSMQGSAGKALPAIKGLEFEEDEPQVVTTDVQSKLID